MEKAWNCFNADYVWYQFYYDFHESGQWIVLYLYKPHIIDIFKQQFKAVEEK